MTITLVDILGLIKKRKQAALIATDEELPLIAPVQISYLKTNSAWGFFFKYKIATNENQAVILVTIKIRQIFRQTVNAIHLSEI